MIDRPKSGERAVLVHIEFPAGGALQEDLAEFKELARSAGAETISVVTGARYAPDPKYFVGSGKAEEIKQVVAANKIELALFNHALTPAQERNLERLLQCRVLDRTGLILDIFAQRARSFEGQLQVELALLRHASTRLVRGWTHLERQRGGIGLRGPGETQLETDRRLIRRRIKYITERITKVRSQRDQGRRARSKVPVPTVALVGYTNAGKSTLFNRLCNSDVFAANLLFATLDPTLRRIQIPEVGTVILADTVGFIRHLPHDLVEAFRATLEEVCEADLLLHIVDVHDARAQENMLEVNQVLQSIGADAVPQVLVFNKIDLVANLSPHIEKNPKDKLTRVWVSAQENLGLNKIIEVVTEQLGENVVEKEIVLRPADGRLRAALYNLDGVLSEIIDEEGNYHLKVRLPKNELEKLFR